MIRDLDALSDALPGVDVCIVGSGPAGMTLARELSTTGLSVMVLESGRLTPSRHADGLKQVEAQGIAIKDYSRERVLGGASTTWAGLSSPFEPIEIAERPWLRHSGWPIGHDELMSGWRRAARDYRFASLDAFEPGGFDVTRDKGDVKLEWGELREKVFLAADPPQDFGAEHRAIFEQGDEGARSVELLLDATVTGFDGSPETVTSARVRSRSGREHVVEARAFVLACGGIENARLLLASTAAWPGGLGNARDQVGRFLMNHPKNYFGVIELAEPVRELPWLFGCLYGGHAGYAGLRLPDEVQERDGLLNSYVRFEPLFPWSGNEGIEAFVYMLKHSGALVQQLKRRGQKDGGVMTLRDYSETGDDSDLQNARKTWAQRLGLVGLVAANLPAVTRYAYSRARHGRAPLVKRVRLRNFMEMEPDPDNRVTLAKSTDAYGSPRAHVSHGVTGVDCRSMAAVHEALARDLAQNGFGELKRGLSADMDPWPIDQDASHHMGTTRMGNDPATSVCDSDCRLHDVDNVFVAGASVLPTSGSANPTFTLVALALRLADHLAARLGRPAQQEPLP